jgi:hypothetical protein
MSRAMIAMAMIACLMSILLMFYGLSICPSHTTNIANAAPATTYSNRRLVGC